ncbi:hypothetical protein JOC77_000451 [Peribacillus deserti]|uniref:DUF2512 domain-containing protein n=1 Tax=Peribacillus deserti TaxID=673318 RepID=A0ABS2QFF6_9BACI|nr:DUF2512 family protein [Peribacillus deserti]MBM7691046.1 hypothetical protein [Peribacillus deserti]
MEHLRHLFYKALIIFPLLAASLLTTTHIPLPKIFVLCTIIWISSYTISDLMVLPKEGVFGAILVDFFLVFFIVGIGLDIFGIFGYKNILLTMLITLLITTIEGIYHKYAAKAVSKNKDLYVN